MEAALKASNKNVKFSTTLKYVLDVKGWIAPHLDEIHKHTAPHVFRFQYNHSKQKAEMFYKHWSHEPWQPTGDNGGLILLKVIHSCSDTCVYYFCVYYNRVLLMVHRSLLSQIA